MDANLFLMLENQSLASRLNQLAESYGISPEHLLSLNFWAERTAVAAWGEYAQQHPQIAEVVRDIGQETERADQDQAMQALLHGVPPAHVLGLLRSCISGENGRNAKNDSYWSTLRSGGLEAIARTVPPLQTQPYLTQTEVNVLLNEGARDFSYLSLRGLNFSSKNLDDVSLQGADLSGSQFIHASLVRANLTRAKLQGSNLSHAIMDSVLLIGAEFDEHVIAEGTSLKNALLENAVLPPKTDLTRADVEGARLDRTYQPALEKYLKDPNVRVFSEKQKWQLLIELRLSDAKFPIFSQTELESYLRAQAPQLTHREVAMIAGDLWLKVEIDQEQESSKIKAQYGSNADMLDEATPIIWEKLSARIKTVRGRQDVLQAYAQGQRDFQGWYLVGADFDGVSLPNTSFIGANLSHAYIHNANLQGSDFSKAQVDSAQITDTNLSEATFSSADLSYTKLHTVNLQNANLESALAEDTAFVRVDFRGAKLHQVIFGGNTFRESDLSGLSLVSFNFDRVNFWQTNLQNTTIKDSDLLFANMEGTDLRGTTFFNNIMFGVNFYGSKTDSNTSFESNEAWSGTWYNTRFADSSGDYVESDYDGTITLRDASDTLTYATPTHLNQTKMDARVLNNLANSRHPLTGLTLLRFGSPIAPRLTHEVLPTLSTGAYLAQMHLPRLSDAGGLQQQLKNGTIMLAPSADATDASGHPIPGAVTVTSQAHLDFAVRGISDAFQDPGTSIGFALKPTGMKDPEGREIYELDTQSYSVNSTIDHKKLGFMPKSQKTKRNASAVRPNDVFLPDNVALALIKRLEKDFPSIRFTLTKN